MEGNRLDVAGENMHIPRLTKETDEGYRCRIYSELALLSSGGKTLADYFRDEYEKNK